MKNIITVSNFFTALILLLLFNNNGQSQQLPFQTYTQKDGMASSEVISSYQDSKGYIWFGTLNGLSCFNGLDFINYDTKTGMTGINTLFEDNKGNLWIGTHRNGAFCFDGKNFTQYTQYGLKGKLFSITQDKHGKLWFASSHGLTCFNSILYTPRQGR